MPVPIMLDTTSAVALTNPSCRISVAGGRGRDVVEVAIGIWSILAPHGRTELVRMLHTPARKLCPSLSGMLVDVPQHAFASAFRGSRTVSEQIGKSHRPMTQPSPSLPSEREIWDCPRQ